MMHCGVRASEEASGHGITYREGEDELRQQRQQPDCERVGLATRRLLAQERAREGRQPGSVLLGYNALLPCGDMLPNRNKKEK